MDFRVKLKSYLVIVILMKIVLVNSRSVDEKQVNESIKIENAIPQSLIDVTFTSVWSADSSTFRRPDATQSGKFYYQVVLITVPKTSVYKIRSESSVNTVGYLYSPSFDKRKPDQDLVDSDDNSGGNRQFEISRTLKVNQRYYLVITTFLPFATGSFTVVVSGPKAVDVIPITGPFGFIKTFSSALNYFNPLFTRPNSFYPGYYYSVIRVTVKTTGDYTFQSEAYFDTYGLLYYPKFEEKSPSSNLIAYDDDSGWDSQFSITHRLVADEPYFLVVTSYSTGTTGTFTVNATGPGLFDLVGKIDQILVNSTLSSTLNRRDPQFFGLYPGLLKFYYKIYQIISKTSAYYRFQSQSAIDAAIILYQNNFSPIETFSNYITNAYDYSGDPFPPFFQFLQTDVTYYLVVTSREPEATGRFTIRIDGRTAVEFVNVSTSQSATNNLLSSLTKNSSRFRRPYSDGEHYYYRVFRITVSTTGLYSIYTSGNVDTFGYIYGPSFDATLPEQNILTYNDQTGGKNQFELELILKKGTTYFLVVTTFREYTFGSFQINIKGPSKATVVVRS